MKVTRIEDVGLNRHYYFDNGTEVAIGLPLEGESGWEYYNAIEDDYSEGVLWFDNDVLVDYDGVYNLPEEVYEALRHLGIKVDSD